MVVRVVRVVVRVVVMRVPGRRHVRVHQRLVPSALAPVARYGHVQLVRRAELVRPRLVGVQVLDVPESEQIADFD